MNTMNLIKTSVLGIMCLLLLGSSTSLQAQRFAYVDTEYIMSKIPEYQMAEKQLDKIAEQWQAEVQKKYAEIEEMYKDYQANQILLTEDMRAAREEEIMAKERAVKEYQKTKFGYEGELFQKRQELVKPIQDQVYEAIEKVANQKAFDFILDKSSGVSILFANPKFNKSEDILRELGIREE